jgi:hypothetical protein
VEATNSRLMRAVRAVLAARLALVFTLRWGVDLFVLVVDAGFLADVGLAVGFFVAAGFLVRFEAVAGELVPAPLEDCPATGSATINNASAKPRPAWRKRTVGKDSILISSLYPRFPRPGHPGTSGVTQIDAAAEASVPVWPPGLISGTLFFYGPDCHFRSLIEVFSPFRTNSRIQPPCRPSNRLQEKTSSIPT